MKRTIGIAVLALALSCRAVSGAAAEFAFDFAGPGAAEGAVSIPSFAVGDKILIRGPDGLSLSLDIVSAPPAGIAGQSFVAKDGATGADAIVKSGAGRLRITVDDFAAGKIYSFVVQNGRNSFSSFDKPSEPDECAICAAPVTNAVADVSSSTTAKPPRKSVAIRGTGSDFSFADQKKIVDILVAFDRGAAEKVSAKSAEWGCASIDDFAEYSVAKMNAVLVNSQLDGLFAYRLAGVVTVDGRWSTINNALLLALRAREGAFATISQLREKYGADTVTLLIDRTSGDTSGIGFEYSSAYTAPAQFDGMNYACNVCDINTVYSRYTMSHETGHNMGCGHSNRQGAKSGPGRYSDSCGYHFEDAYGARRYTIMGYSYTSDDSYSYDPVPYFSAPDISPAEYGCALGVSGVNNNRGTLVQTCADIAWLREHTLAYDWDVRFLDDNGNEIPDGAYFYTSCDVTLTNSNPNVDIYYTLDGSMPTSNSTKVVVGEKVHLYLVYGAKTLTACAVVGGVAQSVRSITLRDGLTWSGDGDGNGVWTSTDTSARPWSGRYFYDDNVVFPDLRGISSATVTVQDSVAPASVFFRACETAYIFNKGSDAAQINIPDVAFAPAGDVTFSVPVKMDAVVFTNLTGHAITFNAPFGQTVDSSGGNFSGMVNIGPYGTLTVAPGAGKTQTLEKLNNVGWYSGTSTFRVGEGTVVFNGAINRGEGVTGRTKLEVGNGGSLVFNQGGATGYDLDQTSLTVEKGGTVKFNDMEHLKRTLYLDGGTVYAKRFDLVSNPGVYVTDDSAIENNNGGYVLIRYSDAVIEVSAGKTLTLGIGSQTENRDDTAGWGIVKLGGGTIVANAELKHSGVMDIEEGTLEVGYSSGATYGVGWIVADGAMLKIKSGCTLAVPALTLDGGATVSVPSASAAPLATTNAVSVADVYFEIADAASLAAGASYPLVTGTAGISDVKSAKTSRLPELARGLKWELKVADNTLFAKVVEKSALEDAVPFVSNDSSLALSMPSDATVANGGGATIDASPIVVDGLSAKAVSVAVKFEAPATSPSSYAAICSWKLGDNVIYCLREPDGTFNCRWGNSSKTLQTTANATNSVVLSAGEHLLQVGYYSNPTNSAGGTRVLLDGKVAYVASGLKFSSESVSRVTFGASAEDSPRYPYAGLVVREVAVLDALSSEPAPRMTASGGRIAYRLNVPGVVPRVFPLSPRGAVALDETVVEATLSETNSEAAVSVMASFPADSVGTVCGMWIKRDSTAALPVAIQAEYEGDGKFYIRFNDNSLGSEPATRLAETALDVAEPHLYTLTFKSGEGATFYQDGVALLRSESAFRNYSASTVVSPVTFGCGPYHLWRGSSWHDYPNAARDFSLYASHIALGTSDRTVSEAAVAASMAVDEPEAEARLPVVDILVAFDNGGAAYVEGKGGTLEAFAAEQIVKMNAVLATNRLDRCYSYRLAGVCRVAGTYGNIDTAPGIISEGYGAAVSLRAARELCGADTVTLLVDTAGATLGNSSPLSSANDVASQHECAFSVCSIRAVDTGRQHTMIHENAHNMGCGHARAQSVINSPFEYGRGFYFRDGDVTRHTIMAYGGDNDASWYFSTSSGEFGFALGDATNDNARVLRETCGAVAQWREGVVPCEDDVVATDASGREILSGRVFATNITVSLAAPAAGAEIYYTLDGTEPTRDSPRYSAPLEIAADATLAVAAASGSTVSPPRVIRLFRLDAIAGASEAVWQTSVKYPWSQSGDDVLRSCNHTNYRYYCTSPLRATVTGPKRLYYRHRSYFMGETLSPGKFSHVDVLIDDVPRVALTECNTAWSGERYIDIPSGEHEVTFVYSQRNAMNNPSDYKDGAPEMDDALWIGGLRLVDRSQYNPGTVINLR
ncbi:MAG: chitobiase/beta-hexosaminidase C-terminal domain-containing protein [Kiritimatiellae bacterium]|nr:chitobiase/beta-hexosaminidase C-terminal domain-containing protein [Kiritimatiellia bacterium]